MRKAFASHMRQVYLMLTEFCPNRCVYCYIKNRHIHEQMKMADVDTLFSKMEYETPRVIFFGGEPLMEIDMMKDIIKRYPHCTYQVITSGSVNYDRFLQEVAPDIKEIQLSWDGPDNKNRPSLIHDTQDESYKRILKTIDAGFKLDVRCVLNDYNIDRLVNTFTVFDELAKKYPRQLHGDFVVAHQEKLSPQFPFELRKGLEECLALIQKELEGENRPYIPRDWLNKIIAVQEGKPRTSCDAGNYIVMRPNGDLYPCTILSQYDDPQFKIGHVNDYDLNPEVIDRMKTACKDEDCQNCPARPLCDGGCRYERYVNFDDWQEHYCRHQCDDSLVFQYTISDWLKSLSPLGARRLAEHIAEYYSWLTDYVKPRC